MSDHLINALQKLEQANALDITPVEVLVSAPNGTSWAGQIKDGGNWTLVKHATDSFTADTQLVSD